MEELIIRRITIVEQKYLVQKFYHYSHTYLPRFQILEYMNRIQLATVFQPRVSPLSWTYRIGFSSDDTRTGGAQIIEFRLKGCFRDGVSRVVSLSQLICQASLACPSLFPPPPPRVFTVSDSSLEFIPCKTSALGKTLSDNSALFCPSLCAFRLCAFVYFAHPSTRCDAALLCSTAAVLIMPGQTK